MFSDSEQKQIFKILSRMNLCGCGSATEWQIVSEVLHHAAAETHSFYRDDGYGDEGERWWEFAAKVCDSWFLLEHGTGIGSAWLTDDGRLLLRFLDEHGTDRDKFPEWATDE
jgi:hypothetical protein